MSGVDLLIAIVGGAVTLMVIVGMFLIAPGGTKLVRDSESNLSGSKAMPRRD